MAAANLKFTYEDFEVLDTPDLIINLWTYNLFTDHLPCTACSTYSSYCEKKIKEKMDERMGPLRTSKKS